MKLLTWMHRKLRQNNTNEMLPPGQAMFNTRQHLHSKQPSSSGAAAFNFAQPPPKESSRKPASFTCSSMEFVELDSSREFPEQPFHYGFLAIGTLGTQTTTLFMSSSEPETPTFSISVDNIADRESQYVTQGELKLINDDLDKKLLGPETKEQVLEEEARNSSTTCTCTAAPAMESSGNNNNNINNVCPLQGYLLGSTVDQLPAERLMPEKKESCRTSLGELFQRQKAADEGGGGGGWGSSSTSEPAAAAAAGEKRSAINHLIRKILKRNNNSAASAETKLHKVLHMFQKKVHPETSTCMPRTTLNTQSQSGCSRIKHGHPNCISYNGDIGSKELWIKSDADYLVLEL